MVLARAECPVNRLDDALLVCDALSVHASPHASDGRIAITVSTSSEGAQIRVSALAPQGARQLVADATIPGVGNVLEKVVDELRFESGTEGAGEDLLLELRFS